MATFIVDWPVLILLGVVFGGLAPQRRWWLSPAFLGGTIAAIVFTLITLASYAIAPDWMWMYFLDPAAVSWVVPLIPLGYLFVFVLGFAAAVALRHVDARLVWGAGAVAAAMEVAVAAVTWPRYHLIGTTEEWIAGAAHELLTTAPTGPARTIGLMGIPFALVLVVALVLAFRNRHAPVADR